MSEQIVLPGFSGDVVLVNGLCYEFAGYTIQPSEDLDVLARFDTCEECGLGVPSEPAFSSASAFSSEPAFSSASAFSSAAPSESALVVPCNGCDPSLNQTYTVAFTGLVSPWDAWNGSHTITWDAGCEWIAAVKPTGAHVTASLKLRWNIDFPNKWSVRLHAFTAAWLVWEGSAAHCGPVGSLGPHDSCTDPGGSGWCTAQNASATTCVVS
jgi:hypothetical protein